jgi:hypothetical protein
MLLSIIIVAILFILILTTKSNYTTPGGVELSDKFNHKTYKKLQLIQAHLKDLLYTFDKLANKHQIEYIADAGTLIGAVRHQGFIPWDDDIDFIVSEKDFKKLKKIKAPHGYKIKHSIWTPGTKLKFIRNGVKGDIDIVTYKIRKGNKIKTPFGRYDYETIFPLKMGKFEGLNMLLPNSPEDTIKFTNDMKKAPNLHEMPPLDKRYPHHITL